MRLSLLFRCKGEVLFGQQYGQRHEANQSSSKIYFLFRIFSVRFRFFRSLIGKQGGKSLNTGGDLYGILRALSDEPINRQRQKRSFRFICRLSIQYIRCVEQRSAYRILHSVLRARTAFAPRPGKTLHRTVLFPRLRVPFDLTKHRGTQRVPLCLVPVVGLEPTRYCYQRILSPSRLPIPSHRRICSNFVHISV